MSVTCREKVRAPVKEGEAVGEIVLSLEGETIGKWELVTSAAVEKRDFQWCMQRIIKEYIKINQEK